MSTHSVNFPALGLALCLAAGAALADGPGLGKPLNEADIAAWDIGIQPDGTGLPAGGGTATQGARIFAEKCAPCHGPEGKGGSPASRPRHCHH
jgi:S-disulfanyl-L-cysteine oxidoreductase SoxD